MLLTYLNFILINLLIPNYDRSMITHIEHINKSGVIMMITHETVWKSEKGQTVKKK